ncbi:MAG: hypothetical protein ACHQSE_09430 [Gemmatimonadales bacterium]
MFVDLLEKLRCPNEHEPSPLIATASRTVDRHIIEGTLGCPVCHAEFEVRHGALELGDSEIVPMLTAAALSDERRMRTGALLGLDERGGLYVLDFISSYFISGLRELSPNSMFVALSGDAGIEGASGVIVGHGEGIPLAAGCARGIVLDHATPKLLRAAVNALAAGGRLVAPADARVPTGIREIAADSAQWVGEREAVPTLSGIRRASR